MTTFTLKPLSKDAIPAALAKAERYRLLNEPGQAESICLDILQVEPQNEDANVTLLLALTDQFRDNPSANVIARANEIAARLAHEYDRAYYAGIVCERRARAVLHRDRYGASAAALGWLHDAMVHYEHAETVRPAHNDDAVLRWNACARMVMELPSVAQDVQEPEPLQLE
jgi:hypothetical protein